MIPSPLVVIGFSTRALVTACCRAGMRPVSFDVFADHDTCRDAQLAQAIAWKKGRTAMQHILASLQLLGQCRTEPPLVLFAGGLENWTELVDQLYTAAHNGAARILGPNVEQLRVLRSPTAWCSAAERSGAHFPLSRFGDSTRGKEFHAGLDGSGKWLTKPFEGAGGVKIASCSSNGRTAPPIGYYLQQQVFGRVLGAHFACNPNPQLLGVTESFVSDEWPGPSEFIYRGSWGPLSSEELNLPGVIGAAAGDSALPRKGIASVEQRLLALATSLQQQSGLLGWLQLDVILDPVGELWLVDVNPRWSAGMEVLVDSGTCNPVVEHLRAFDIAFPPGEPPTDIPAKFRNAKAVVYAKHPFKWSLGQLRYLQSLNGLADIPPTTLLGQSVEAGEPLVTVKSSVPAELDYAIAKRMLLDQLQFLQAALFTRLSEDGLH